MSDVIEFILQAVLEVVLQVVGGAVRLILGLPPSADPTMEALLGLGVISSVVAVAVAIYRY